MAPTALVFLSTISSNNLKIPMKYRAPPEVLPGKRKRFTNLQLEGGRSPWDVNAEKERWQQDQKAALDLNVSQAARKRTGGAKAGVVARACDFIGCTNSPSYGHAGTNTPEFCSNHHVDRMVDLKRRKARAKSDTSREGSRRETRGGRQPQVHH